MQLRTNDLYRGALIVAIAMLAACGDEPALSEPKSGAQIVAESAPAIATDAATTESASILMRRANDAFLADRILSSDGDNAVELFLKVRDLDAEHPGLNEVLVEIMPLANYGFESALRSNDVPEAQRLLALMQRLNGGSHAVKAAAVNLDQLRIRLAQSTATPGATSTVPVAANAEVKPMTATPAQPVRVKPAATAQVIASATEDDADRRGAMPAAKTAVTAAPPTKTANLIAPIAIAKVTPEYPSQAKRRNVEGFVELEFVVNELGGTEDIRVVRSEPQGTFDRSAVRALMRWRFKPAERDGKPEVAKTRTTVNFRQG